VRSKRYGWGTTLSLLVFGGCVFAPSMSEAGIVNRPGALGARDNLTRLEINRSPSGRTNATRIGRVRRSAGAPALPSGTSSCGGAALTISTSPAAPVGNPTRTRDRGAVRRATGDGAGSASGPRLRRAGRASPSPSSGTTVTTPCSDPVIPTADSSTIDPPSTNVINQGLDSAGDQYTAGWDGVIALDLSQLAHANPSFSSVADEDILTFDFGAVALNSTQTAVFSLFNLYSTIDPENTVGLDLDSWNSSGDIAVLSAALANFSNLAPGSQSSNFNVSFDTSTPGNFTVAYTLDLSDADVGAGMDAYHMTLKLFGVVQAQNGSAGLEPLDAPEPATIASFATGLFVVAWMARRRRKSGSA